jgi:hypothetical protein
MLVHIAICAIFALTVYLLVRRGEKNEGLLRWHEEWRSKAAIESDQLQVFISLSPGIEELMGARDSIVRFERYYTGKLPAAEVQAILMYLYDAVLERAQGIMAEAEAKMMK